MTQNPKFRLTKIVSLILTAITLFCFSATIISCSNNKGEAGKEKSQNEKASSLPHVTLGIQVSPAMAIVMVAQDKNFFKEEGVEVEIKEFTAGKFALQAFLGNSLDFAVTGEVPVCLATLQGNKISVLSQVVSRTVNEVRVVARKDERSLTATEYFRKKKRKLATSFGGGPEFYTYNFLNRFGIKKEEVEIISQKPEDMPAALETGSVDAVSIFDPFAFIAEQKLAGKGITYSDSSLYSELYILNGHEEHINSKPEISRAILKALVKSSLFIKENPEDAKRITQKYTKLDGKVIDGIWKNFHFDLALNATLLQYWKAEAKWAKETGKLNLNTKIPDFRGLILENPLKDVKPDAIKI